MAGEHVLVVEDSPAVASVLVERILPIGGYQTTLATDRESALACVERRVPDLVLLDLQLPGASGLEILSEMRNRGLTMPVIMMTAHGSENTVAQALRLGIQDYVIKPFSADELLARIEQVLIKTRGPQPQTEQTLGRWLRKLTILQALGQAGRTSQDTRLILERGLEAALETCGAQWAYLYLTLHGGERLVRAAQAGKVPLPHHEDQTRLHQALRSQTCYRPTLLSSLDPMPVMHMPLWARGQVLGVLSAYRETNRPPFGTSDEQLISLIADYLALVVALAQQPRPSGLARGREPPA